MSVKTAGVGHFTIPTAPAAGTSVTSGAANTFTTTYVQLIASTAAALYITGVFLESAAALAATYIIVQLASGGAGSETIIGQYLVPLTTGSTVALGYRAIFPPIPVANATRIAVKSADSVGAKATLVTLECVAQSNVVDDGIAVGTVTTVTNQLTAAAIATGVWQDAVAGDFTTASSIGKALFISNVAPGGAGGHMISGSNAGTTTLAALTITGASTFTGNVILSDGLTISAPSTADRAGITISGNGAGAGISCTGGTTGQGFKIVGGATSGDGIGITTTSGHGISAVATGTTKHGIHAAGGATTSHGINALGGGVGHGILATSGGGATGDGIRGTAASTNGNGINGIGVGTGAGILVTGGATGIGFSAVGGATSGSGMKVVGTAGNAIALEIAGQGSAAGMSVTGGATGIGLAVIGGGTSGDGIKVTTTSGHGINLAPVGTDKHGFFSTGGNGGTSDGMKLAAGTGGVDLRANQTGNLVGTVSVLTTYTGNTPQTGDTFALANGVNGFVATKVDTAAIKVKTDFLPSVTAGAAGGVFIAGTNAATVITTSLTTHLIGTVDTVTAVTGLTAADVGAIKTKTDFLPSVIAGGAGGVFIAGTNAATTITTGLTAHIIGTVDTLTTYTGNTPQTGDSYAIVNSGTFGNSALKTIIDAIKTATDNLPSDPADESLIIAATNAIASLIGVPAGASLAADVASVFARLPIRLTKNTAFAGFTFPMIDSSDHVSGKTGRTVTAKRSIDGAAFGACANAVAEISNGFYKISFDAADLNGNSITLLFTAAGCDDQRLTIVTQP